MSTICARTLIQQYLFEVNVVGFSSREALASDAGSIFPSWPYQEYQIRIVCIIDGVLSRHQAHGLRSTAFILWLYSSVVLSARDQAKANYHFIS